MPALFLALILGFFSYNPAYAEVHVAAVSDNNTPDTAAPVKEQNKNMTVDRKLDLHAIIFDPEVTVENPPNADEMSMKELAEFKIHEALHGEVSVISKKGLLADQMRLVFEEGPIQSINPWFDYNGYFSNVWSGADYQNTLYGINFSDVGVDINMRNPKVTARVMVSPIKSVEGRTYFQSFFADNYVIYHINKNNKILTGHTWIPLGIEGRESPLDWHFFNRSQTSMKYSSVRALGTKFMGNYKYLDCHLGVYSSGRAFRDFFPGPEFAGWFEFKPLANVSEKYGKLTIGTGFDVGNAEGRFAAATGAINYEYKRLKAITEFGFADGSNGALGYSSAKSRGINGTIAYRITPRIQALARYDQFDANVDKTNDFRREYTAGINYFIKGQALKLMLNFVYYTLENGGYGSRIMTGTQIIL